MSSMSVGLEQIESLDQVVHLVNERFNSMDERFSKLDGAVLAVLKLEVQGADQRSDIDELKALIQGIQKEMQRVSTQSHQDAMISMRALEEYKVEQLKNQNRMFMFVISTLITAIILPVILKTIGV